MVEFLKIYNHKESKQTSKQTKVTENMIEFGKKITCDPSLYTMDNQSSIVLA